MASAPHWPAAIFTTLTLATIYLVGVSNGALLMAGLMAGPWKRALSRGENEKERSRSHERER